MADHSNESYDVIYDFEGLYYTVNATEEIHHSLSEDAARFAEYLKTHEDAIELSGVVETRYTATSSSRPTCSVPKQGADPFAENVKTSEEAIKLAGVAGSRYTATSSSSSTCSVSKHENGAFLWTDTTTRLLLEEYRKRKEDFRNPKMKKVVVWRKIIEEFIKQGYNDLTWEALDAKFRNLKKTYIRISDNNSKSKTGRGAVKWQYFDIFSDIFHNDATVNIDHSYIMGSSTTINTLAENKENHENNTPARIATKQKYLTLETEIEVEEDCTPRKRMSKRPSRRWQKVEEQRRECLEMERKRVALLDDISNSLKENNEIQREKNTLLKRLLEKL